MQLILIVCQFHVCEFPYLLKFISNPEKGGRGEEEEEAAMRESGGGRAGLGLGVLDEIQGLLFLQEAVHASQGGAHSSRAIRRNNCYGLKHCSFSGVKPKP